MWSCERQRPGHPRAKRRARRDARLVAVAAQRGHGLDRRADDLLGLFVDQRRDRRAGHGDAASRPRSPGMYDQISSVTNGMIGCSSVSDRSSTQSSVADGGSSDQRRGFASSRYQSQTSLQKPS